MEPKKGDVASLSLLSGNVATQDGVQMPGFACTCGTRDEGYGKNGAVGPGGRESNSQRSVIRRGITHTYVLVAQSHASERLAFPGLSWL